MDITINDPVDVDGVGMPIYEGPADEAYTILAPGTYATTVTGPTVLVREDASIPAMIDRKTVVRATDPVVPATAPTGGPEGPLLPTSAVHLRKDR